MKQVKVTVEIVPSFFVKIDGEDVGEFKKLDEWEGMIKLKNKDGETLILSQSGSDNPFDKVISMMFPEDKNETFEIVKISPGLIPEGMVAGRPGGVGEDHGKVSGGGGNHAL